MQDNHVNIQFLKEYAKKYMPNLCIGHPHKLGVNGHSPAHGMASVMIMALTAAICVACRCVHMQQQQMGMQMGAPPPSE